MKLVIIINGSGGVGKDEIINVVSRHYKVVNRSSIDPIKDAAEVGWADPTEFKTDAGRKFLSDLKRLFIEYNDCPTNYLFYEFDKFERSENQIMFAHIREPEEIDKFKGVVNEYIHSPSYLWRKNSDVKICTLLVTGREDRTYGNTSDDGVLNYDYDYTYQNDGKLEDLERDFMEFFNNNIKEVQE